MMNSVVLIFLLTVCAYLLGSIPSAVWIGKVFYGKDVRKFGSGNAGATNTFRTLGAKAGIPVLFIDSVKGIVAVQLAYFAENVFIDSQLITFKIVLGVMALVGHIFPILASFRGGKGVATLLGVVLVIHFQAALLSAIVFLLILFSTKYVSLSSMIAAVFFPFSLIFLFSNIPTSLVVFAFLMACVVVITHRKNIIKLIRKEESKVNFKLNFDKIK